MKETLGSHGRQQAGRSFDRHRCSDQFGQWCVQLHVIPSPVVEVRLDDALPDVKGAAVMAYWQTAYLVDEADQIWLGVEQERRLGDGKRGSAMS